MADLYGATPPAQRNPVNTQSRSKVSSTSDVLLYFIAIFVPPLPVLLKRGLGADFCINILLWILGWIPGVIHSWYIISKSEGAM